MRDKVDRQKYPDRDYTAELPMRDFQHSLPMALLRAREAVIERFRPLLSSQDISEQQWRIVRALREAGELEISELARRCCILLPSMSGMLKRLEARNLVRRTTDAADQRRSLISLTEEAHWLFQQMAPLSEAQYAEIERLFGAKRLQTLYDLLFELESVLRAPTNEQADPGNKPQQF